ncbi:MAG: hypothetical protein JXA69_08615 [Phycisphaerae bacterium]|nr:hypothetical protein [Phycisphaerae bacterium]
MSKKNTIECEACGCRAPMARSVRMRVDPEREFERIKNKFPDLNAIPEHLQDEFFRAYVQYHRNSQHRRAFICLECYATLDKHYGVAAIPTKFGKTEVFHLSGDCRGGRAAVYNYAKWRSYQSRKAAQMGVAFTEDSAAD